MSETLSPTGLSKRKHTRQRYRKPTEVFEYELAEIKVENVNTKEKIEVMQGKLCGKIIECRLEGRSEWRIAKEDLQWNFKDYEFRIKPKPREFYINIYNRDPWVYNCKGDAEDNASADRIECIHVKEVL